jgi:hypothetical protein
MFHSNTLYIFWTLKVHDVEKSYAAHCIDPSIFDFIFTWPPQWCHMHHPSSLHRQFWGKLGNPSPTCFQAKHDTRSRWVSRVVLHSSVLWCNWQTVVHLVLRNKPRNRLGDFEAQITKLELPVLRPKSGNRPNQETCAPCLIVHGTDGTRCHLTSQSCDHWVPDLCLTIPGPLHQVSYSCQDPCCCPPCHTCHLHTMRPANAILHIR